MTARPSVVRFADLYDVPAPTVDGVWAHVNGAYVWKPITDFVTGPVDAAHLDKSLAIPAVAQPDMMRQLRLAWAGALDFFAANATFVGLTLPALAGFRPAISTAHLTLTTLTATTFRIDYNDGAGTTGWISERGVPRPFSTPMTSAEIGARAVDATKITIDYFAQGPTGSFLVPATGVAGGAAMTTGTIYFCPFWIQKGWSFTGIQVDVVGAGVSGDTGRLGLYADDGTCKPGVRVFDAGAVSLAATGNALISQAFVPAADGLFWGAFIPTVQTGAPTLERCSGPSSGPLAQIISGSMTNNTFCGWSLAGQAGLPADMTGLGPSLMSAVQRIALVFA